MSRLRGGLAVGSRLRSSWIMCSTSSLVQTLLRSSSSTMAAIYHMLEMASSWLETSSLGSRFAAMVP